MSHFPMTIREYYTNLCIFIVSKPISTYVYWTYQVFIFFFIVPIIYIKYEYFNNNKNTHENGFEAIALEMQIK